MLLPVAVALTIGGLVAALTGPMLRRLPTQAPSGTDPTAGAERPAGTGDPDDVPPHYPDLATPGFTLACGGLGAAATVTVLTLAPAGWLPLWLVWSTLFAVLVAVDARTTWLPLRLTRGVWMVAAVAIVISALSGPGGAGVRTAETVRVLLGALAATAFYLLLWRVGHGLGFGDVRISPLIGALGASVSWTGWWVALLAGSVLGALWGTVRSLTGRRGPFPYGPWMWLGPAASILLDAAGPLG
ncbi:prepilin peptidase [Raineyella sp. W15-4]|uniref:prepilin peptidase n=1 Tax=Raineyella sp. W15-4 TaxID=3081651 RepID=UPI002953FA5B|nr:prepilin peptidase [Raineyella sp. W15-4]WOQ15886.1 prepilin peptidase [Raineyella sp. W15-4]